MYECIYVLYVLRMYEFVCLSVCMYVLRKYGTTSYTYVCTYVCIYV